MYIPNTHYKKHEKTSKNPLPVCIVKKLKLKNISWKFFLVGQGRNWKEIIKFKIKGKRFLIEKSLQMLIFLFNNSMHISIKSAFACLFYYSSVCVPICIFPKTTHKKYEKNLTYKGKHVKIAVQFQLRH